MLYGRISAFYYEKTVLVMVSEGHACELHTDGGDDDCGCCDGP